MNLFRSYKIRGDEHMKKDDFLKLSNEEKARVCQLIIKGIIKIED